MLSRVRIRSRSGLLRPLAARSPLSPSSLTNESIGAELGEPLVIAVLADWITLSYVLGGIVVWWCRPDSRLGSLMVVAGFVSFLATLSWSSNDALFTVGQTLDVVAPVVFLHVFLAFPSGRLRGRFERLLVLISYVTAIGLELVRMLFGDFGPHNLLELAPNARATELLMQIQLVAISGFCLCGVGVLVARRRRGRARGDQAARRPTDPAEAGCEAAGPEPRRRNLVGSDAAQSAGGTGRQYAARGAERSQVAEVPDPRRGRPRLRRQETANHRRRRAEVWRVEKHRGGAAGNRRHPHTTCFERRTELAAAAPLTASIR
jgi:hypothetical protein